eukprot:TRINITY_DN612_c0_g3_i1.p1 TRINITY_DN612_c0_g3~~TRINITY_DN612_c0_g3_i1.p1  ORF type:complete len:330 (+),score=48.02 TRINITY_DN612_c0_g3_i1:192-1181(+)
MPSSFFLFVLLLLIFLPISLLCFLWCIVRPRPSKIEIRDRHVFISGGSSGIGLAIAHKAAQEGARVSILARDVAKLAQARASVEEATGVRVQTFSADVRNFEETERVMKEAGPVDVLICNHGIFIPEELEVQSLETMRSMMDINVMGTIHLIKAALPLMKSSSRGSSSAAIAIMSSQAGQVGVYGYSAYSSSKFALRGLAEVLQQELIEQNIHVSMIFPPDTNTPGLVEENKTKPEITKLLSSSSSSMEAADVAQKTIAGIKSGKFIISCNFEGFILSTITAGMSPQPSPVTAFVEVVATGFLRLVALCVVSSWYGIVHKEHTERKKMK